MRIPDELGLRKGWVYEVIVTVAGNAAPMGILSRDFESVEMEVYKGSKTCENILERERFVINFVDDMVVFYDSIFGEVELDEGRLGKADAFIEAEVRETEDLGDRVRVRAVPVRVNAGRKPRLRNRAKCLALEALIAKTKLPHVSGDEREFLERKVRDNLRVVKKVAPGSRLERMLEELVAGPVHVEV